MNFDILVFYDRLVDSWENKRGLFGGIALVGIFYFIVIPYSCPNAFEENKQILYLLSIPVIILIFIVWLWSTNRFFFKFGSEIVCGIIVINDEPGEKLVVNRIVRKVISKINKSELSKNVKLKMLPANFCETKDETLKYYNNYSFLYDVLVKIYVESGNYESIEKIKINQLAVTFAPNSNNEQKRVFFNIVDLIKDMDLQIKARDWEYSIINSGFDKKKYLANIYHIILYYLGFYAIYTDRFEDALEFMSQIYNPQNKKVEIAKTDGQKISLNLRPINIAEARLATILVDLFFQAAIKNYFKSDIEKALHYFKKLEELIKEHPAKFDQYINMARYSYELGNLKDAIRYTEKASLIKPNSLQVTVNKGFFAILDGNIEQLCSNYHKIFQSRFDPSINWVDILEFQLIQKDLLKENERFFEFTTSFIDYLFINHNRKEFEGIIESFKNCSELKCIFSLGKKILNITLNSHPSPNKINKKPHVNKSKRKKRKKRNR